MPYLIKRPGSGLTSMPGSSFGGMIPPEKDEDSYLAKGGGWTTKKSEAHKFGLRQSAENWLIKLAPSVDRPYEIVED